MDKAARAALLTAKGTKSNRAAYALGGSEDGIDVYHASPNGIVGKFKPSANDVGIHFAANPELAHNAAVKSAYHKPRNAENIAVQKFRINAKPEQIVDIPAQGNRFDFYDILEHLHGIGRIDEGTFNKTYDKLQEIEDRDMTYERMNPVFSRALAKSNIKALRYMNNFDAGPTWKDMNEGRMTSHVTPDHSYMVTDPSAIEYPDDNAIGKSTGGAMEFARHVEAVHRAGGQIAPSKYLPNVPRAVHAGGGEVGYAFGGRKNENDDLWWHGSASGDLRGGVSGLHLGTKEAALDALRASIGVPADGSMWDGTREYGKTLLAGKNTLNKMGRYLITGHNVYAPDEDYYPHQHPKGMPWVGNRVPVDPTWKPFLRPFKIVGKMNNDVYHPHSDRGANASMKASLTKGNAKNGYYYRNIGEDEGSISAVVPNGSHVVPADNPNDPDITKAGGGEVEGDNGHIYVVHGGSDFDQIDPSYSGRGEPGNIRPLGKGLYGYVLDHADPENFNNAIKWATRYSQKYGGGKKALHVYKIPKSSSTVFNGYQEVNAEGYPKPIEGLGSEPTEELNAYKAHKATEPPYDEKNSADFWAHERKRRALWDAVKDAADLRMEHLPIGLTEVAIQNPKVATRIGKFSLDTPTSDILDAVKSDVQGGNITKAGDGKVAFQEGNHPLVPDVLYHGTARDIQSFDPDAKRSYDVDPSNPEETDTGWFGKGHYFTASPKLAAHYADEGAKRQGGQGAQIYPAHVAMKNPFVVDMKAYDSGAKTLDNALSRAGVPMHPRGYRMPSEQTAALVGMGYDGVIATREGKPEEYVAFHPTQIKSAIGNQGTFDPNDPDITKAEGGRIHANGGGKMDLRSKAAQVVRDQPQAKGNVDQMLAMMAAKGVKPSELLNAGRPFGHSVSKEELAQHFENAVPDVWVEERGKKPPQELTAEEDREFQKLNRFIDKGFGLIPADTERWKSLFQKKNGLSNTKYGQYTLPGGKNYREHLLHLPPQEGPIAKRKKALQDQWQQAYENHAPKEELDRLGAEFDRLSGNNNEEHPDFKSSHWNTPNVLAHVRMDEHDNGKTLHVQEVQSDWGQEGREKGFHDPENPFEVIHKKTKEVVSRHPDYRSMTDAYNAHPDSANLTYGDVGDEKPPQGPYVGNTQQWTDLALKHVLNEAAKGGHDRVVFSPGEANADLYGQREKVQKLQFIKQNNGGEAGKLRGYLGDGRTSIAKNVENHNELAKLIGKENATNLLAQNPTPTPHYGEGSYTHTLEGPLQVGGHGMVDYYKNYVHSGALKLLRQHDPSIQPESYDLPNGYKGFSLPMTDTARQSILKNGFGAFKRGGTVNDEDGITAYHSSPHDFDQFDISRLGTGEGNQSYGPGLYFAENPKVSDRGGQYWNQFMNRGRMTPEKKAAFALNMAGWDRDKAVDRLQKNFEFHTDRAIPGKYGNGPVDEEGNRLLAQETQEAINHVRSGKILGPRTYKVKLNVKPHELIDWDEPLSEQHPNIQAVLGSSHETAGSKLTRLNRNPNYLGDILGKDTATLQELYDHFRSKGIKGIRYNDAGSRHGPNGDSTKNYVMFHHDPVQVTDKYEYGGTVGKEKGGRVVYQGRSSKGIKQFFNPSGQSWGTTHLGTAKQFAGQNETFYPGATPRRAETSYRGEVHKLRFNIKNPMRVDIKETMFDAKKEKEKVEEAKAKGHDGLEIYHSPTKSDFVAFSPDQVEHLESSTPDTTVEHYNNGGTVDAALALTRRFTKDGIGATVALKSKGK